MPVRFDTRPLVHRRPVTATMRMTRMIGSADVLPHVLHLGLCIVANVLSRNVANQLVLDQAGAGAFGKLFVATAIAAGLGLAAMGRLGQNLHPRRLAKGAHLGVGALMLLVWLVGGRGPAFAMASYVALELSAGVLILVFGICMGANLEANDARRSAAKVGAGGIAGGLAAGIILTVVTPLIGTQQLFLLAAGAALAPLALFRRMPMHRSRARYSVAQGGEKFSGELTRYGRLLMITTLLMALTTQLIEYQYRSFASLEYSDAELVSFFGTVTVLAGLATILFQLTALDRLLSKWGLFPTALVMPGMLIVCSLLFGLVPGVLTLAVLKLMDSGTNMSVQQASGGLLLAPLGVRARALWQSRLDGFAKRGGQLVAGLLLIALPMSAVSLVPVVLLLCALWVHAVLRTRHRYIRLLGALLRRPVSPDPEMVAVDGATLRILEAQVGNSSMARATVALDLLAMAGHRVPDHTLERLIDQGVAEASDEAAVMVVDYLSTMGDITTLKKLTRHAQPRVAGQAVLALQELSGNAADECSKRLLAEAALDPSLLALVSGLRAPWDAAAMGRAQDFAGNPAPEVRLAVAQGLAKSPPAGNAEVTRLLESLAADRDDEVAKAALEALALHVSEHTTGVLIGAMARPSLRGVATQSLAQIGAGVTNAVGTVIVDPETNPAIAARLCWVLAKTPGTRSAHYLHLAMQVEHVMVRLAATIGLCHLVSVKIQGIEIADDYVADAIRNAASFRRLAEYLGEKGDADALLLRRLLKQRAKASQEIFFRLLSLKHSPEIVTQAYHAFFDRQRSSRQLALELLDTLLTGGLRTDLAHAAFPTSLADRELPAVVQGLPWKADPLLRELLHRIWPQHISPQAEGESMPTLEPHVINQILELQSVPMFHYASADDLSELVRIVEERHYEAGDKIYEQGARPESVHIVREGRVSLASAKGREESVGPGNAFGVVAVMDGLPYGETALAKTATRTYALRGHELEQVLTDRPLLMHSVLRSLAAEIRSLHQG